MKDNPRMKHLLTALGFLCLCALLTGSLFALEGGLPGTGVPGTMLERTRLIYPDFRRGSHLDYAFSPYSALYERAAAVALVTPADILSAENSFGTESGICETCYSTRTLKVLRYFKNTKELSDTLEVAEDCALASDGTVYATDGCYPTIKGDIYLVFLAEKSHGRLRMPAGCEGVFDLTYLRANENPDAVLDAINALGLLVCDDKDKGIAGKYFSSKPVRTDGETYRELDWKTVRLGMKYTKASMYICLEYCRTESGYMFRRSPGLSVYTDEAG